MHTAAAAPYKSTHKIRFVTATSLFDGHDAATNIIRRILQASGAEVIHLGHNRSVDEIVTAAIQEDAQGIAVSCYQGGHVEFFKYIRDLLEDRVHYLGEIVQAARGYRKTVAAQAKIARALYQLKGTRAMLEAAAAPVADVDRLIAGHETRLDEEPRRIIETWPALKASYRQDALVNRVRDREIRTELYTTSLSGTRIPRVSLPDYEEWGEIVTWSMKENLPGSFPYTAEVFPFKRAEEDPKRQFAGEGTPERTNRRFHYLCQDDGAKRLSTAFDSVTLYGEDPDYPPDVYGKVGESGVSICTVDDVKKLYAGFDLCAPSTSVSITINGPAPMMLAMFFNAAIDQQLDLFRQRQGREPDAAEHDEVRSRTIRTVRGTVQADILKEEGHNTCIFSTIWPKSRARLANNPAGY